MKTENQTNVENQEFGLQKLDPKNLSELKEFEKSQKQLVEDHPFVEITDSASYKEAKKNRTALKTGRTTIEKQDRTIGSVVSSFRKGTKAEAERLILITQPHEEKQQSEIDRHEAILQAEKDRKERIEQERIDGIKNKIEEVKYKLMNHIESMTYENIKHSFQLYNDEISSVCDFDFAEYKFIFDEMVQEQRTALKATKTNLEEEHKQKLIEKKVDEFCEILELDGYLLNSTSDVYEKSGFEISKSAMVKMTMNDLICRTNEISEKIAKINEQKHQQNIQEQKNRVIEVREGLLDIIHQMNLENEEESIKYIDDSINKNSNENKNHYNLVIEEYNKAVNMVESALKRKIESLKEDRIKEEERIKKEMEIFFKECERRHELFSGLGFECEKSETLVLVKKFKGFGMEYTSKEINSVLPDQFDEFIQQTKRSIELFKENDKKEKERQERLFEDKDKIENFLIDFPIYFAENQIFDNLKNEESKKYFKTIEREFMNLCKTFKNDLINM